MKRTLSLLVALVLVAGTYFALRPWLSGDERVVRENLRELAEAASFEAAEQRGARLGLAASIGRFFTPDVTIDIGAPFHAIRGRDAVMALAATAPVPRRGVRIEFVDVQVWMGEDRQSAVAYLTATGAASDQTGESSVDARELEMGFRKMDGEWLVERIKEINPIEPVR